MSMQQTVTRMPCFHFSVVLIDYFMVSIAARFEIEVPKLPLLRATPLIFNLTLNQKQNSKYNANIPLEVRALVLLSTCHDGIYLLYGCDH